MLNVLITVDTEIWCGGWADLDTKFPASFRRYVYGPTPSGDYALPFLLKVLSDHGLDAVFFVEPLFATRFGIEPLREVVGLIQNARQEVQLHLHTEWADEALNPLLPGVRRKRQHLRMFSQAEQVKLIAAGLELLKRGGADSINTFRAGNFGANSDTLIAVGKNGLDYDSSYSGARNTTDIAPGQLLTQPQALASVTEYPVTVFRDHGPTSLRPLHVTACSFNEMTWVLNSAADSNWDSVVVVLHNFELMDVHRDRPDPIAVRRFRRLCSFLERHHDRFNVRGFRGLPRPKECRQPEPIRSHLWLTGGRCVAQAARHAFSAMPPRYRDPPHVWPLRAPDLAQASARSAVSPSSNQGVATNGPGVRALSPLPSQ